MQDDFSQFSGKRICLKISQTWSSNNLDQQLEKSQATNASITHIHQAKGFMKNVQATGRKDMNALGRL